MAIGALVLVLSSGGLAAATFLNRRYEEALPATLFSMVLLLYVCGLLGLLRAGVYLLCALGLMLYLLCAVYIVRNKSHAQVAARVFTPAFVMFAAFCCFSVLVNYGRVIGQFDEFSHWAATVKAMLRLDDFSTNPQANLAFAAYPPALSLLQYFLQVLNGGFAEWLLFVANQTAAFVLFLPFFKRLTFSRPGENGLLFLGALLLPTVLSANLYGNILVDCFLGILTGYLMAAVLSTERRGALENASILLGLPVLTLCKRTGLALAAFVVVLFAVDCLALGAQPACCGAGRRGRLHGWRPASAAILTTALAKLSWALVVARNGASDPFARYAGPTLLQQFGAGGQGMLVVQDFAERCFSASADICALRVSVFQLILLLLGGCMLLYLLSRRAAPEGARREKTLLLLAAATMPLYLAGELMVYLSKFTVSDAIGDPSLYRYLSTILYAILMLLFCTAAARSQQRGDRGMRAFCLGLVFAILFLAPMNKMVGLVSRYTANNSVELRMDDARRADRLSAAIEASGNGEAEETTLLLQVMDETDYWVLRYELYPMQVVYFEYGKNTDPERYRGQITACDYFLFEAADETFRQNCADLFSQADVIKTNRLYRMDSEGRLTMVDY